MIKKTTRLAYLKRIMKRLEAKEVELRRQAALGQLSAEELDFALRFVRNERAELVAEARELSAQE